MIKSEWKTKTYGYTYLSERTNSRAINDGYAPTIVLWLMQLGIVPYGVRISHGARTVPNLDGERIPAEVLAGMAYDFDQDGSGTPEEFLEVVAFEINNHPRKEAVGEILSSLGREKEVVHSESDTQI